MRLVTYHDSSLKTGVLVGSDVVMAGEGGVGEMLRSGGLPSAPPTGDAVSPSSLTLLPPVPDPGKIICLGLNYRQHAEEAGIEAPEVPTFSPEWANALAAPGADVPLPSYSAKVDYEADGAFVIARRRRRIGAEKARAAVA